MSILYRRIFKTQTTGVTTIQELLQTMFVAEVVKPGEEIWIVSPWISNVVLIDNRTGSFDALNPEWGRRECCCRRLVCRHTVPLTWPLIVKYWQHNRSTKPLCGKSSNPRRNRYKGAV